MTLPKSDNVIQMYTNTYTCVCVCVYLRMCVCIHYTHVYKHIHIREYTHTHAHTKTSYRHNYHAVSRQDTQLFVRVTNSFPESHTLSESFPLFLQSPKKRRLGVTSDETTKAKFASESRTLIPRVPSSVRVLRRLFLAVSYKEVPSGDVSRAI